MRRAAGLLLVLLSGLLPASLTMAADDGLAGRYGLESPVGGAVWALQPSGLLVVVGPGDLVARGSWQPGAAARSVDLLVRDAGSRQQLTILGALSPDGRLLALCVAAEPSGDTDGPAWPARSRLLGTRLTLRPEATTPPAEGGSPAEEPSPAAVGSSAAGASPAMVVTSPTPIEATSAPAACTRPAWTATGEIAWEGSPGPAGIPSPPPSGPATVPTIAPAGSGRPRRRRCTTVTRT